MIKHPFHYILLLLICMALPARAEIRDLPVITVLAPPSLSIPLTRIIRDYSRQSDITVNISYAPAHTHIQSIIEGEEADIIIADDTRLLEQLKLRGLIDVYSRTNLFTDQLVIANRADAPPPILTPPDTTENKNLPELDKAHLAHLLMNSSLVLPNPRFTPAGNYALLALESMGVMTDVNANLNYVNDTQEVVRNVLAGDGTLLGVTYLSLTKDNKDLSILSSIPASLHPEIIYQGAVVAGRHMKPARKLLGYLRSNPARQVFEAHGLNTESFRLTPPG